MSEFIHTRRSFLHRGIALVSGAATVPLFLDRTANAMSAEDAPAPAKPGKDHPILVVIQLAGGNDGLNTLIPYRDDAYYRARPRIGIKKSEALRLTDDIGLNPAAEGFKKLFDAGQLSIIQGVGYPNPNRSHFVATDIWSTGDPEQRKHDGWLGRYLDCTCTGADPDPRGGIAITQEVPLAMVGDRFSPVSFSTPGELTWRSADGSASRQSAFKSLNNASNPFSLEGESRVSMGDSPGRGEAAAGAKPTNADSALAYLERVAMDARASAAEIQRATGGASNSAGARIRAAAAGRRGGQLTQQLGMVRRMIAAGLPTRVYYVSLGGFDTHAQQPGRHTQLLRQLGDALAGFIADLKSDRLLDRVLTMTFSEFGRRVTENASQGTDHGAAAPMFIAGSRVKPGILTPHPSLEAGQLDRGDLKWKTDFRGVYADVLGKWLKVDAEGILGGRFNGPSIVS